MIGEVVIKEKKNEKKLNTYNKLAQVISVVFFISAVVFYVISQYMINSQIIKNVVLVNNSKTFDYWTKPPAKVIRKYYFFSIDNPFEVSRGEKPVLSERGPYTYIEKLEKKNIKFLDINVVQYNPVSTLFFEPSLSVGSESDQIKFLNLPAMGMIEEAMRGVVDKSTVNFVYSMMETKLFLTRTVGQIMGGYEDDLLGMAMEMVPDKVKSNIFSMTDNQNGTITKQFTIKTGYDNIKDKGKIITFNGKSKQDIWDDEVANEIKGTDGTMFPPFISNTDKLWVFNPDMCRPIYFEHKEDTNLYNMNLKTFHLPRNIFYNSSMNPLNQGFCSNDCLGNGVQNISRCFNGLSAFVSQPHFLYAEEKFVNAVSGLKPNEKKHESIMNFNHIAGVPINAALRLQINYYLPNDKEINLVENVKPHLLPILWFEANIETEESIKEELSFVDGIIRFTHIMEIVIICISISLMTLALILSAYVHLTKSLKYRLVKFYEGK